MSPDDAPQSDSANLNKIRYRERWFCYIDLLGFTNLVQSQSVDHIVPLYRGVLRDIERHEQVKGPLGISFSWFSDTFIIYSKDATLPQFSLLEQAGRLFFQKLILQKIPARGAITIGKLYADKAHNIFIGDALIDAYAYGEKQDWLGLLLTPRVYEKLRNTEIDLEHRLNYRRVTTPGIIKHPDSQNVFAFCFNNHGNNRNPYLDSIRNMKALADEPYRQKYLNTEEFILRHGELFPAN